MSSQFVASWLGEYRLIREIWNGEFPDAGAGPSVALSILEKSWMSAIIFLRSLSLVQVQYFFRSYNTQSEISEFYVLGWLLLLGWLLWTPLIPGCAVVVLVIYRLVDAFNYRLSILFVDRYKKDWGLRSLGRSLILVLFNYLEMIVGFGILYLQTGSIKHSAGPCLPISSPIEGLYFSTVTITTLGYGDLIPCNDVGRILVTLELVSGFIFVALVVGLLLTGARFVRELDAKPTAT
jgi:voltage-gated potassium channel Kch